MRCKEFADSPLIIYFDGPRDNTELANVEATRAVAKELLGTRARYIFHEKNIGLAQSVINGVNETLALYGRAIIVEDDLWVSPQFLEFMNNALDRYADDDSVLQISGYLFGKPELESQTTAIFQPFIGSWGWATWQRAWRSFDPDAKGWLSLRTDSEARRRFNLDNSYDYATMLFSQMTCQGQSWAIRWYWSVFKANGLVLYPPFSLVRNTGLDGSGTHGRGRLRRIPEDTPGLQNELAIELPETLEIHQPSFDSVKKALRWRNGLWLARVVDKLRWWKVVIASYRFKP